MDAVPMHWEENASLAVIMCFVQKPATQTKAFLAWAIKPTELNLRGKRLLTGIPMLIRFNGTRIRFIAPSRFISA
jgi:hypothetical protein